VNFRSLDAISRPGLIEPQGQWGESDFAVDHLVLFAAGCMFLPRCRRIYTLTGVELDRRGVCVGHANSPACGDKMLE